MAQSSNSQMYLASTKLFLCVNCQETPEKEVYQCEKGHVICSRCILKVKTCPRPRCAVVIRSKPIRSLVAEAILDSNTIPCPFKTFGCDQSMKREDISTHRKLCKYRCSPLEACRHLGFGQCKFIVFTAEDLRKHLHDVHSGVNLGSNSNEQHGVFYNIFDPTYLNKSQLISTIYWEPKDKGIDGSFLLNRKFTKDPDGNFASMSYAAFYLGDEPRKAGDYWITITVFLRKSNTKIKSRVDVGGLPTLYFKHMLTGPVKWFEISINYLKQMKEHLYPEVETGAKYDLIANFSITLNKDSYQLPLKRKWEDESSESRVPPQPKEELN